jgi:outer membrane protein assembly factor BamB
LVYDRTNDRMKILTCIAYLFAVLLPGLSSGQHRLLLRDEGMSKISFVDESNSIVWQVDVPAGRDLQLAGRGRILLGTANGYEEREISTGDKLKEVATWPGTIAVQRLVNGNTMLIGVNWQGKQGIILVELNGKDELTHTIVFPGFTYARLFRVTEKGTFLITADKVVFEGDENGNVIWKADVQGPDKLHAWQAMRIKGGETVVATGFAGSLQFFNSKGELVKKIGGQTEVSPHFFAGFQILSNGNYVVTNWQGHGPAFGDKGIQLLEFNVNGDLVWSYKQDPSKFSSLQGVIVLDGLNIEKLHTENEYGVLTAR